MKRDVPKKGSRPTIGRKRKVGGLKMELEEIEEQIYLFLSEAKTISEMDDMINDINVVITKAQYKVVDETGLWEGELK